MKTLVISGEFDVQDDCSLSEALVRLGIRLKQIATNDPVYLQLGNDSALPDWHGEIGWKENKESVTTL